MCFWMVQLGFGELRRRGKPRATFIISCSFFPYIKGEPKPVSRSHLSHSTLLLPWERVRKREHFWSFWTSCGASFQFFQLVSPLPILHFLFPLHFLDLPIYLGREMGKFKPMVDSPERLVEFKRAYGILDDIGVSYCPKLEVDFVKGEGRVVIPLVRL